MQNQKSSNSRFLVIAESTCSHRSEKHGGIIVAGAGGGWLMCGGADEFAEAIKRPESGERKATRASVYAKAKNWIKFPCRVVVEILPTGEIKVLYRIGRGSEWFIKAIGLGEQMGDPR